MGEVTGAPPEFNPRWKGMRRRALEDPLQLLGVLRFFGAGIWGFKQLKRNDFLERELHLKKDAQKQFKHTTCLVLNFERPGYWSHEVISDIFFRHSNQKVDLGSYLLF